MDSRSFERVRFRSRARARMPRQAKKSAQEWPRLAVAALLSPVTTATSQAAYERAGWVYVLGIFAVIVALLEFALPAARTLTWRLLKQEIEFQQVQLNGSLLLAVIVATIALAIRVIPALVQIRNSFGHLGGFVADCVITLLDGAITAGEWCIDHRRAALIITMLMLISLCGSAAYLVISAQATIRERQPYALWCDDAAAFVINSQLNSSDARPIATFIERWAHIDRAALDPSDRILGYQMSVVLASFKFATTGGNPDLQAPLLQVRRSVNSVSSLTDAPTAESEELHLGLLFLAAKLTIRVAPRQLDPELPISKTLDSTLAVIATELSRARSVNMATLDRFRSASSNLSGIASKRRAEFQLAQIRTSGRTIDAESAAQNIVLAVEHLRESMSPSDSCTQDALRAENNILDLIAAFASLAPEKRSLVAGGHSEFPWEANSDPLRARVAISIADLLSCGGAVETRAARLATVAQAFAICAALSETSAAKDSCLHASGSYLRASMALSGKSGLEDLIAGIRRTDFAAAIDSLGNLSPAFTEGFYDALPLAPSLAPDRLSVVLRGQ
jgi:hypothetical protein